VIAARSSKSFAISRFRGSGAKPSIGNRRHFLAVAGAVQASSQTALLAAPPIDAFRHFTTVFAALLASQSEGVDCDATRAFENRFTHVRIPGAKRTARKPLSRKTSDPWLSPDGLRAFPRRRACRLIEDGIPPTVHERHGCAKPNDPVQIFASRQRLQGPRRCSREDDRWCPAAGRWGALNAPLARRADFVVPDPIQRTQERADGGDHPHPLSVRDVALEHALLQCVRQTQAGPWRSDRASGNCSRHRRQRRSAAPRPPPSC